MYNQGWAFTLGAGHTSQQGTLCTENCLHQGFSKFLLEMLGPGFHLCD